MNAEAPLEPRPAGRTRAVVSLTLLAAVAAAVVGLAWLLTRSPIAANEDRRALAQLAAILPPALYDNNPLQDQALLPVDGPERPLRPVWRARRDGRPVAAVLTTVQPKGYGGPIRLLVGIDIEGRVLGARASAHTETPGIGDFVDGESSDWMAGFTGRTIEDPAVARWAVDKDGGHFDAVTGATITSRAAVAGVLTALQYFLAHEDEIFAAPAVPTDTVQESAITRP